MGVIPSYINEAVIGKERFPGSLAKNAGCDALHIVFGFDNAYARGMGVSITSLLKCNPGLNMTFHLFCADLSGGNTEKLSELSAECGCEINIYHLKQDFCECLPLCGHYSAAMYYRLVAPAVLQGTAERVLYLDSDFICMSRIDELPRINLEGCVAAVVSDLEDFSVKRSSDLGLRHGQYFNSGFMYIDVEKWNREGISQIAIDLLSNSPVRLWWPDQDALNLALDGRVKFLDRKWNVMYDMGSMTEELECEPVFLHYTAALKPWHAWCRHSLREHFNKCAAVSPWRSVPLEEPRIYDDMLAYAGILAAEKKYTAGVYCYCRCALFQIHLVTAAADRKVKKGLLRLLKIFGP
jgi:lipopolysaccharide biosynthesis glycosyltransferase